MIKADDGVAGQVVHVLGDAVLLQVIVTGMQADFDQADTPRQQLLLAGAHHAHGNVGFQLQQVAQAVGQHQFHLQVRVFLAQLRDDRRQYLYTHHFTGRYSYHAAHLIALGRGGAFKGGGGTRHGFCMRPQCVSDRSG
ncbi:hypothetical protein PFLmoz3_02405 [Pseudomonas fluorescens]|uniref:Uncharacterized protein n=1 Tax=Pseudomonas fluorescens TaxID=294 RepID=A0A109LIL3_PSEFL|nr:hypothetical protein PFLmoz3_02405 [Pseudomonas fluorescens]